MVQPEDSALFHCILPNNQRTTIRLAIKGNIITCIRLQKIQKRKKKRNYPN